jgi:hypothetical protein
MRKLSRAIQDSGDKLFFIRRHGGYGPTSASWALVQVDLNETDPVAAKDFAIYRVKWYAAHELDCASKPLAECRFWPLLQEATDDGTPFRQFQLKPAKVSTHLQHVETTMWLQADVALGEDCLVGPFDFTCARIADGPRNKVTKIPHRIDELHWQALERIGPRRGVDTSDVRESPTR